MEGPRPPREGELPKILEFLNNNLRPQATWSIASEYPTALTPANSNNIRVITDQGQVISHSVLKPLMVKTPLIAFKLGAIGSVVTDDRHRNQGFSNQIISDCLAEAKKQDCDLAILWTSLHDFYRKMNFELAGFEESILIQDEFIAPNENLRFVTTTQVSAEALQRLYTQHTVTTFRTTEDIRKFLQIPQTQLYTAWDSANQLVAYAVEGKGADLTGYVHEWGGAVSKLMALFSYIRREKKQAFTVIIPHHSINLLAALKKLPVIHNTGFLGMLKIVNEDILFSKIRKAALTVGIANFVLDKKGTGYVFGTTTNAMVINDEKDLIRCLFGPLPETGDEQLWRDLQRLLPLPLWLWGWDSI